VTGPLTDEQHRIGVTVTVTVGAFKGCHATIAAIDRTKTRTWFWLEFSDEDVAERGWHQWPMAYEIDELETSAC
jgi:hypothetical protein